MTFLNLSMLIGLAALAVPVIIHLLNRSRPRPIEWGAMQFLLASMTARHRRVKIEDAILLCLRCLSLAFLALALARPFLPSLSAVPWVLILPGILIAVLCLGIATVLWPQERMRRRLLRIAAVMLVLAVLASLLEQKIQARRWMTAAGGGDLVIVLDASLSMTLATDRQTTFARAVEEARSLITRARPGDAIALILAGPVPQALVRRPTSDRSELLQALERPDCKPAGGSMAALEALNLATAMLADGPNVSKTVVVLTDGQAAGWDPQAESRWNFLAEGFKTLPSPPRVICRRLPHPDSIRNALVSSMRLSRSVIGTDRPVKVEITLMNSGNVPIRPSMLEWVVDGKREDQIPVAKDLLPQVAEVFHFTYGFKTPGYHVVQARIAAEDDLPSDNVLGQIVHVMDHLPVLLVEGASSERFFFRKTASLLRVALTPREPAPGGGEVSPAIPYLVSPTIVEAADIATIRDLAAYRVILLADVPRLPAAEAARISAFVKGGGGLFIAPGTRADAGFYNSWQTSAGETILPALLDKRAYPSDPLRLDLASFTHPAVQLVAQPEKSDARLGLVSGYWQVSPATAGKQVRVGARLESGEPWLMERQLGAGRVFMLPLAFDRRDSNLSVLKCFVPLVHEMVYALAESGIQDCNVMPGAEWARKGMLPAGFAASQDTGKASVSLPGGGESTARIEQLGNRFTVRFSETWQAGVYRVRMPVSLAESAGVASNSAPDALFAVTPQPGESTLTLLSDADVASIRSHVPFFLPGTFDELLASVTGKVPGQELWKILILCALLTLVAEALLTRWITLHRQLHQDSPVALRSPAESVKAMKNRLMELMNT